MSATTTDRQFVEYNYQLSPHKQMIMRLFAEKRILYRWHPELKSMIEKHQMSWYTLEELECYHHLLVVDHKVNEDRIYRIASPLTFEHPFFTKVKDADSVAVIPSILCHVAQSLQNALDQTNKKLHDRENGHNGDLSQLHPIVERIVEERINKRKKVEESIPFIESRIREQSHITENAQIALTKLQQQLQSATASSSTSVVL